MTATVASLCEQVCDQAAELGLRIVRAAGNRQTMPAEAAIELRAALAAVRRAGEALDRAQSMSANANDR